MLFHWCSKTLVRDTGFTQYFECKKCGKRTYKQKRGGYQPIDKHWLAGGNWSIP